jgi:3-oxoacyl-[acyl-carrier-protein] synthase II
MSPAVVITGTGVVAPNGIGNAAFLEALRQGRSGIDEIRAFDTSNWPVHRGGEVKGLRPRDDLRLPGRTSLLAWTAAAEALADAGLNTAWSVPSRVGLILGTTSGEIQSIEEVDERWALGRTDPIPLSLYAGFASNAVASTLARVFRISGPVLMIANACSSGNFAISYGCDLIRDGDADMVLAGGADAFSKVALAGFSRVHAVAPEVCQPFSKNRKGMMVSEGAGLVILESLEHATRRGARTLATVLGAAVGCDAFHLTAPDPEGMANVIRRALDDARVTTAEVGYVNAHGTGTPANDAAETSAIKRVFGELAYTRPVSSIKSMIGHTMGAASAIETVACCLALQHGFLPPTMNFDEPDPECDLDYVPNRAREQRVDVIMNNSFAFGGNNASLVLGRPPS